MKNLTLIILTIILFSCQTTEQDSVQPVKKKDVLFVVENTCEIYWGINGYQNHEFVYMWHEETLKAKLGDTLLIQVGMDLEYKTVTIYQEGIEIKQATGQGFVLTHIVY